MSVVTSGIVVHALRMEPGQDVLEGIREYAKQHLLKAASVISVVGSLSTVTLRYAGQPTGTRSEGLYEVVALSGTLSDTALHLHMLVCDEAGVAIGGHLTGVNIVRTTLELVLGEYPSLEFARTLCPRSGYPELSVRPRGAAVDDDIA